MKSKDEVFQPSCRGHHHDDEKTMIIGGSGQKNRNSLNLEKPSSDEWVSFKRTG
jgi:hypothetical protein